MTDPRVRPAIRALAGYYVGMTGLELVLAATHVHQLRSADGTVLFESAGVHTGIHVLMSIALVVAAVRWRTLGRPAMWALGAILAATSLLSLVHREVAGAGLGHDTMPVGYLVVNGFGAGAALVVAWLTGGVPHEAKARR